MAQIESSFFYGYCLGVAPMGFIADKIGARVLISIAIGGSGAISLLTEVAAKGGVAYFMVIRVFQVRPNFPNLLLTKPRIRKIDKYRDRPP